MFQFLLFILTLQITALNYAITQEINERHYLELLPQAIKRRIEPLLLEGPHYLSPLPHYVLSNDIHALIKKAQEEKKPELIRELMRLIATPDNLILRATFAKTIKSEDYAKASILLDGGVDPNEQLYGDWVSPLHRAAAKGNMQLMQLLVEKKASINIKSNVITGLKPGAF
jgi:hypothetical protein